MIRLFAKVLPYNSPRPRNVLYPCQSIFCHRTKSQINQSIENCEIILVSKCNNKNNSRIIIISLLKSALFETLCHAFSCRVTLSLSRDSQLRVTLSFYQISATSSLYQITHYSITYNSNCREKHSLKVEPF